MGFGVRQGERASPRSSEDEPALDTKVLAQPLHVVDQIPGRVFAQLRVGTAFPTAALIEQNDAVMVGIEKTPVFGQSPAPRSAVNEHRGTPLRVAAFFEVNLVKLRNAQHSGAVGLQGWVKRSHRCLLVRMILQIGYLPAGPPVPFRTPGPGGQW